jgi:predicted transcriptional regulator of viral defense system
MRIDQLRNSVENEEIDYVMLMSLLSGYSNPRDKISRLLRSGDLIRVKKGLYVFGPGAARKPYIIETIANQIYGPSAISLEYALSWYGMIPERATTVTSITTSRNKLFRTPIGQFSYQYQHPDMFSAGVDCIKIDPTHTVLMVTREKALFDQLSLSRACPSFSTVTQLREYLVESLRIDPVELSRLNLSRVVRLEKNHRNRNVSLMRELLLHMKDKTDA